MISRIRFLVPNSNQQLYVSGLTITARYDLLLVVSTLGDLVTYWWRLFHIFATQSMKLNVFRNMFLKIHVWWNYEPHIILYSWRLQDELMITSYGVLSLWHSWPSNSHWCISILIHRGVPIHIYMLALSARRNMDKSPSITWWGGGGIIDVQYK